MTLTTCDGIIGMDGICSKCYQPAMTSSNICGRLYEQIEEPQEQLWFNKGVEAAIRTLALSSKPFVYPTDYNEMATWMRNALIK